MNSENYIKSHIARIIVGLLLEESGYTVISLGSERIVGRLVQAGVNNNKVAKLLFSVPNFVIVNKKKEPLLLSVRYKGHNKSGRNIDWGSKQLCKYWPNSLMMIVSNQEPFFLLLSRDDFVPLAESVLKINKKMSDKYAHLAKKFLLD